MNEREIRDKLENCIRACQSLLDQLAGGQDVPTEQDISSVRYEVWTLSETVDAYRKQLDRYEAERNRLAEAEEQMRSRIEELRAEIQERTSALAAQQRELELLERELGRKQIPKEVTRPCAPEEKPDEQAPGDDIPALISTLDQQNETALGLR